MAWRGFCEVDERLAALSAAGDPLERLSGGGVRAIPPRARRGPDAIGPEPRRSAAG